MKKNNKGYTLVELLGVITLIGILSMIAVPAMGRVLSNARKTSTDTMMKSTYEAAENYMMKKNIMLTDSTPYEIAIKDLVDEDYLEPLVDPRGNQSRCQNSVDSKVIVTRVGNTKGSMINYKYVVNIVCPQSGLLGKDEAERTFPK